MAVHGRGVTGPPVLSEGGDADGHDAEQMLEMHHHNVLSVRWAMVRLRSWLTFSVPHSLLIRAASQRRAGVQR